MKYFWDRLPGTIFLGIIYLLAFSGVFSWVSVMAFFDKSPSAAGIFVALAVFCGLAGLFVSIFTAAEVVISEIKNLLPKQDVPDHDQEEQIQPKFD